MAPSDVRGLQASASSEQLGGGAGRVGTDERAPRLCRLAFVSSVGTYAALPCLAHVRSHRIRVSKVPL